MATAGRPPLAPVVARLAFRVPAPLRDDLADAAERRGVTLSHVVRLALAEWVANSTDEASASPAGLSPSPPLTTEQQEPPLAS